jgi:hypothetical protein
LQWITSNGDITTGKDYPYKARQGECDHSKMGHHTATIFGYRRVATRSEASLKNTTTSVSVSIEAGDTNI